MSGGDRLVWKEEEEEDGGGDGACPLHSFAVLQCSVESGATTATGSSGRKGEGRGRNSSPPNNVACRSFVWGRSMTHAWRRRSRTEDVLFTFRCTEPLRQRSANPAN